FMTMELLDGGSLKDMIRSGLRPPLDLAVHVMINVFKGLEHSHQTGIVHQDMKPANLMIQADGGIKIADYGISKIASPAEWKHTGKIKGTPAYMAPEQAAGKEPTYRWDLFSAGVVFYELVAGFNPFGSRDPQVALRKIVGENPPPLVKAVPTLAQQVEGIVARLLHKEPEQRYPNATSVLADLNRLSKEQSLFYSQQVFKDWIGSPDEMGARLQAHRSRFHLERGKATLERGTEWWDTALWDIYRAALLDRSKKGEAAKAVRDLAQTQGYVLDNSGSMNVQAFEKQLADKPDHVPTLLQGVKLYKVERNPLQTYFFARAALGQAPLDKGLESQVEKLLGKGRLAFL
ncbi:MAG: serine/threonine-protein kinase, partial [Acidobacteriota bacterium]